MGFPVGWTVPSESFVDDPPNDLLPRPIHILRRNAIGNAIAVPVLSRLILALLMALRMVPVAGTPRFPSGQTHNSLAHTFMTLRTTCWSKQNHSRRPSPNLRDPSTPSGEATRAPW